MSPAEFCRELEAYLCRKNEGHLIRIVGPVFGTVTGWAEQGIPLKVACRGIDRYFDRHAHKPRRRPVPIQFCEADILDAFDEWRRALGLSATAARSLATPGAETQDGDGPLAAPHPNERGGTTVGAPGADAVERGAAERDAAADGAHAADAAADVAASGAAAPTRRKAALQTHIDRAMARLTQRRVDAGVATAFADAIDRILARLDTLRADAKGARNETRERIVGTLAALDREMLDAASAALDEATQAALRAEAGRELDPFRSRMPPDAYARAAAAATDRLIRERARLPILRVDE